VRGPDDVDDLELLRRWQAGQTSAGRELVSRHYAAVYRFFYGKVDPGFCEDLTQATFEVLCRRRDAFRGEGASFRGFLFGIARMKLIEHIRGKLRAFDPMEHSVVDPASAGSVSSLLAERQHEHLVAQALRELSLDDQVLLELKEYEQLTLRELAALFDVTLGAIAGRVTRARERLRTATERLVADPGLRAASVHDLESCMRNIGTKIAAHLGGKDS
jgi:RNA polymerase sigma-70 factor (ECF subfamily)